jgi:quercetin dioxygenase-like cupin family protein
MHPEVIENPVSGERIVIRKTAAETGGELLLWDLYLAAGGRVPSTHAHPVQEETFTVLAGTMRFRVGRRVTTAAPGVRVRVPPGSVHSFANAGPGVAHVLVETRPALRMEELLSTAATMARETQERARVLPTLPRPVELLLFMRDFEREVRAPYVPVRLVQALTHPLARLARRTGIDARYRRWRGR